ncbi:MAG: OmpA family protein [Prevotella sp.]|nr:OmpA family protein [Prevotella sp.]MDE6150365.1 OmpA family protein [Prevotella sp.]
MSKKHDIEYESREENAFLLSTGDLMAGLLFIFILLLMGALLQVQEKAEEDKMVVQKYDQTKGQLYIDLQKEFKDSLEKWNATIDSTLCIRFQEPRTLFAFNRATLSPKFQVILKDFFPRYIKVLNRPKYKNSIAEIRIEGHTDSSGEYFYNMELSQDRTRSVLEYCFGQCCGNMPEETKIWMKNLITANGLSSSRPILVNGRENAELSRRVEFRVRTDAEKHLEDIVKKRIEINNE